MFRQKIEVRVKKEVDEATNTAKADKEIGFSEMTTDVYSNPLEPMIRGPTPEVTYKHATLNKAVNLK